jgi:hypothetical protein
MPELVEVSTDDQQRTVYEPIVAKIQHKGNPQYGLAFAIEGLRDFWSYKPHPEAEFVEIQVGQTYRMTLATKPNTKGGQYHDIRSIEPVDAQASSDAAQDTGPPPSVPEGAPAPKAAVRGSQPPPRPPWEVTDLAYYHRRDAMIALQVEVKARVELACAYISAGVNTGYRVGPPATFVELHDALNRLRLVSDPVLFPDGPPTQCPSEAVAEGTEVVAEVMGRGIHFEEHHLKAFQDLSHLVNAAETELGIGMGDILLVLNLTSFDKVDYENPDTWARLVASRGSA